MTNFFVYSSFNRLKILILTNSGTKPALHRPIERIALIKMVAKITQTKSPIIKKQHSIIDKDGLTIVKSIADNTFPLKAGGNICEKAT